MFYKRESIKTENLKVKEEYITTFYKRRKEQKVKEE